MTLIHTTASAADASPTDSPTSVWVQNAPTDRPAPASRMHGRWEHAGTIIDLTTDPADGLRVDLSTLGPVSRIALRWNEPNPPGTLVRGDAWERSYGDLEYRPVAAEQIMPWYVIRTNPASETATGFGVDVLADAMASWSFDADGRTLWLDVRSGAEPADLHRRTLHAATVRTVHGDAPELVHNALVQVMLGPHRRRGTPSPIVGANNWYYAYGEQFDEHAVLTDARTIAALAGNHTVRPFSVIDDGWNPGGPGSGGPWTAGTPGTFDDMHALADAIRSEGARPGIWFRPLRSRIAEPNQTNTRHDVSAGTALDPSRPGVLARVADDIHRLRDWGYELIKHDFSSYDIFGQFGTSMGFDLTDPGWRFSDTTRTTAEVIRDLYRTIADAADDAVIIGCNTIGHLAVGSVDVQRTGDDTSGRHWERTRRMGVNTLAHRLPQHDRFFTLDADCVAATPHTDWAYDRQFLDLVARSGTALFISADPAARTDDIDADLASAVRTALNAPDAAVTEPVDVLTSRTPSRWRFEDGDAEYQWMEPYGSWPGKI